jgi:hypothetical protein
MLLQAINKTKATKKGAAIHAGTAAAIAKAIKTVRANRSCPDSTHVQPLTVYSRDMRQHRSSLDRQICRP